MPFKVLDEFLRDDEGRAYVRRRSSQLIQLPWSSQVADSKDVEFAADSIEADKKNGDKWRNITLSALPEKLFELEKRLEDHLTVS